MFLRTGSPKVARTSVGIQDDLGRGADGFKNAPRIPSPMGFLGFGKKKHEKFTDPVCGMEVSPDVAVGKAEHDGTWFYFCSQTCMDTFNKNPHKYAHGTAHH
jgi:YHS domain-containing protein